MRQTKRTEIVLEDGDRIEIRVKDVTIEAEYVSGVRSSEPRPYVRIRRQDDGALRLYGFLTAEVLAEGVRDFEVLPDNG